MTTTDLTADGRYGARTATGPADFTSVVTMWSDGEQAWTTRVDEMVGCEWTPLEFHTSATEDQARKTHRAAVRRHPKKGQTRTLPRGYGADERCTRCGGRVDDPHAPRCKD